MRISVLVFTISYWLRLQVYKKTSLFSFLLWKELLMLIFQMRQLIWGVLILVCVGFLLNNTIRQILKYRAYEHISRYDITFVHELGECSLYFHRVIHSIIFLYSLFNSYSAGKIDTKLATFTHLHCLCMMRIRAKRLTTLDLNWFLILTLMYLLYERGLKS